MYIDYLSTSRMKGNNTGREYLTAEELETVTKREFNSSRLERVRDIYLFACYTGLTYQDIKNLQKYQIIIAKDGTHWLSINRSTMQKALYLPLSEIACRIIDKYKDYSQELLLPVPSIQKLNAYLKEIVAQCNLDRNLSFQSARSTFAVTIGIANNISKITLSKMFGFQDYATRSTHISDKQISKEMLELSKKLVASK